MDNGRAVRVAVTAGWRSRVKPLLGTLVEISIPYRDEAAFLHATDASFARVQAVHQAMSFHEQTSDIHAIARARAGDVVRVSADTFQTLKLALEIERDSHGAFNPTIAPILVARGLLPAPSSSLYEPLQTPEPTTLVASIVLDGVDVVRVLQPVWIDLGGIAKGLAVDVAVGSLQLENVAAGLVNAGGDMRVFGARRHTLALRLPNSPSASLNVAELCEFGAATSAGYFHENALRASYGAHPAIVGDRATTASSVVSVTVIAARCAVADALTKVLWLRGGEDPLSRALLARHSASAVLLGADGAITRLGVHNASPHAAPLAHAH